MFKVVFFLLLGLYLPTVAQNSNIKNVLNSVRNKEQKTHSIDSILLAKKDSLYMYRDDIVGYTDWLVKNKQTNKAIGLLENLNNSLKYSSEENSCNARNVKYKLGVVYYKKKEYKLAIQLLKGSLLSNDNCEFNYPISILIAACYSYTNDYYSSINYIEYALTIVKKNDPKLISDVSKKKYINSAINISKFYNKLEGKINIEAGREYLLKGDSIAKLVALSYNREFELYIALFSTYNYDETLSIEKGLYYLRKALLLVEKAKDSSRISSVFLKKGSLYNTTDYDKSIFYHEQAHKYISKSDFSNMQYYLGNSAYLYLQKKEFDRSVYYSNKRVKYLTSKNISQLLQRTNDSVIYNTKDKNRLYKFLDYYAQAITASPSYKKDASKRIEIINVYFLIDTVIDQIQQSCTDYKSKLHWRKIAKQFYSKAVDACYLVNDVNSAFYFVEKNKAQLLLQDVFNNEYKQKLPQGILAKEKELKKAVLNTTNFISSEINVALQMEQQKRVFKSKLQYQQYKDSVEQLYPIKAINKGKIKLTSLKNVQQNLLANEVFVSYFWYSNKGYEGSEDLEKAFGVLVSPSNTHFFKISDVKNFEKLVSEYKNKVSQPFNTIDDREEFNEVAYQLYNTLFPTTEIRELLQNKKLLIASDNQLQNIPFEALITNKKTNSYLLNSSEVAYVYSMSFLEQNNRVKRNATHNFMGYSPENFSYSSLDSLTQTTREIKTIQNSIGGDIYVKEEASKELFLKKSGQYKIIHLATHASTDEDPWIAFNDSKLELHELYTYKSQADLVVLSACNTANGELAQGEGVMSLARGFFHSGANSVLSTLWNANDKATADIMKNFYQNLSDGNTKSKALQLAKQNYIQSNSLSDASPYYWASFVLIGDADVLPLKTNNWYWLLAIVFCFLVTSIYVIKRRNSE